MQCWLGKKSWGQMCKVAKFLWGQTKRRGQQLDRSSSRVLRWQVHRYSISTPHMYPYVHIYGAGQAATVTWSLFTTSHATRTVFAIKMDFVALLQHTTHNIQHVGTHFFQRRQINCHNFCQPLTFYFAFKCFNFGAGVKELPDDRSMGNMCKPGPDTFEYYFLFN